MKLTSIATSLIAVIALAAGCLDPSATADEGQELAEVTPVSEGGRTVAIHTSGCGAANDGFGTGVLIDDQMILTAAHVVASSMSVTVDGRDGLLDGAPGTVVAMDRAADLALISIVGDVSASSPSRWVRSTGAVDIGRAKPADVVTIALDGDLLSASVVERSLLRTAEVRGTAPVERVGYRLDVETDTGDSGAGVYLMSPGEDNVRLVGLVFANSADVVNTSWAVAGSEIEMFLAEVESAMARSYQCDEAISRLVLVE